MSNNRPKKQMKMYTKSRDISKKEKRGFKKKRKLSELLDELWLLDIKSSPKYIITLSCIIMALSAITEIIIFLLVPNASIEEKEKMRGVAQNVLNDKILVSSELGYDYSIKSFVIDDNLVEFVEPSKITVKSLKNYNWDELIEAYVDEGGNVIITEKIDWLIVLYIGVFIVIIAVYYFCYLILMEFVI